MFSYRSLLHLCICLVKTPKLEELDTIFLHVHPSCNSSAEDIMNITSVILPLFPFAPGPVNWFPVSAASCCSSLPALDSSSSLPSASSRRLGRQSHVKSGDDALQAVWAPPNPPTVPPQGPAFVKTLSEACTIKQSLTRLQLPNAPQSSPDKWEKRKKRNKFKLYFNKNVLLL